MPLACKSRVQNTESLTKEESKLFIKRMLAISTSNITYNRQLFHDSAYSDRTIKGIGTTFKILKEKETGGPGKVTEWIHGAFDAIDKGCLKQVVFALLSDENDPHSIIETYSYNITYENGTLVTTAKVGDQTTKILTVPTKAETQESIESYLRNLKTLTSHLGALPPVSYMTMRLLYYDDKKPENYQPPGFEEAFESDTLRLTERQINIKVGKILTPYNTMKLNVFTPEDQFTRNDINSEASKSAMDVDIQEDKGVRCPCDDVDDDDLMIQCSNCKYWQHAICYCIYNESKTPSSHICHICCDTGNQECTDPTLANIPAEQQKTLCLWRRLLLKCLELDTVNINVITSTFLCSKAMAQKLLKRLIDKEAVSVMKNHKKIVNKRILKAVFKEDIKDTYDTFTNHPSQILQPVQNTIFSKPKIPTKRQQFIGKHSLNRYDTEAAMSILTSQTSLDDFDRRSAGQRKRQRMSKQKCHPVKNQ
uniref:HORMA domain-containing protein 2-like n=1 Tax=Ciona intestinalis TaxID=7719 RepID=UPI0005212BCC|nr:HORMA domain-containing protein 2-like [Ciona intestinalis]|eukprot:XP_009860628.1 HORMA domain-containing protein 2-like [Ciona intestinalis]